MRTFCDWASVATAAVVLLPVGAAFAQAGTPVVQFKYDSLNGSYVQSTATSGVFTADVSTTLATHGTVTKKTVTPSTVTTFDFTAMTIGAADFSLSINVSAVSGTSAAGFGSFTVTDVLGNELTGSISGDPSQTYGWSGSAVPSIYVFSGLLEDVHFVPAFVGSTLWWGTDGTTFDFTDLGGTNPPYQGAVVQLSIDPTGTGFFGSSFSGVPTSVSAQVLAGTNIPAPASIAALGLGVLFVGRRKR